MKRFLSRFSRQYDRSLLYMLQASEYNLADYFAWYRRVEDFRNVQHRKQLVWTLKARALYVTEFLLILAVVFFVVRRFSDWGMLYVAAAAIPFSLLVSFILPYWFALIVIGGRLVQWPIERIMIARARAKLRKHPAFKIAIAGSFGKTSMREILKTVLAAGKKVHAPGGSENTPIGIARFVARLRQNEDVLIFELGEYYPGDIKLLAEMVRPDLGIITGVNEAHLEKFGSVEAAANTIFELADFLGGKPLYVNAENGVAKEKAGTGPIFFSREGVFPTAGGWKAVAIETSLDGTSFALEYKDERINIQSKLLGLHNVGPLAAAVHIAKRLGLTNEEIEAGVAKTKPFAHRLERRDDASGVITLDDSYNGNPDGVTAVIEFLASIEGKRRWYVTPGLVEMGEKSEEIHKDIGKQLAEANIEKVVLIKNSVTPWIEQGYKEYFKGLPSEALAKEGEVVWFDEALDCYNSLPHMTVAGDVVVLQNDWPDQYA